MVLPKSVSITLNTAHFVPRRIRASIKNWKQQLSSILTGEIGFLSIPVDARVFKRFEYLDLNMSLGSVLGTKYVPREFAREIFISPASTPPEIQNEF